MELLSFFIGVGQVHSGNLYLLRVYHIMCIMGTPKDVVHNVSDVVALSPSYLAVLLLFSEFGGDL